MHCQKFIDQSFPQPSPRGSTAFYQSNRALKKRNIQTFQELLDTDSEVKPISGDPKHLWSTSLSRSFEGQVINGVLAQVYFTLGAVGPQTQPMIISQVLECIIGLDILNNWQKTHIGSLTCGVKAIMVGKAK